MPIFAKQSKDLVYDLINQSNPDLPVPANASTVTLNTPTAIAPGSGQIQNTQMVLTAPANSPMIGKKTISYRRIDLSNLFRSVIVQIEKYSAAAATGNTNTIAYSLYQLLADLNTRYGMSFTTDDLNDINILRGSTQNAQGYYYNMVTVTAKTTSLAFVGSFSFRWVQAPQDIATMITQTELAGRAFPGGNDFVSPHKQILNSVGYSLDFTSQAAGATLTPATGGTGVMPATGASATSNFLKACLAVIDQTFGTTLNATEWWRGYGYTIYSTANASWPFPLQANSRYYNRVLVLDVGAADATYAGKLYIHYNV